jgi:hypothetical protein
VKKYFMAIFATLLAIILLFLIIQFLGIPKLVYNLIVEISKGNISIIRLNILNIFLLLIVDSVFGVLGFKQAKKKKRNIIIWTVLCSLFNLWAFLVLYNLPYKERSYMGRTSEIKITEIDHVTYASLVCLYQGVRSF